MQAAWMLETLLCPTTSPSAEERQFSLPTAGPGGRGRREAPQQLFFLPGSVALFCGRAAGVQGPALHPTPCPF